MSRTPSKRPPAMMISNVIDALPVTQSQSRYAACYHHHCANIIRVSVYTRLTEILEQIARD